MTGERVLTRLWEAWKQRAKGALALSLLPGFCQLYGDRVVLGIRYETSGAALFSVLLYSLLIPCFSGSLSEGDWREV